VLAVVNQFPAPSQTFILRKLTGLRDAGLDVTVAASTIGPGAAATGLGLVELTPWHHPAASLDTTGRAGWAAVARDLTSGRLPRNRRELRDRMTAAPLLAARADIVHFEFSGIAVAYRHALDALAPARLAVSCRGAAEQIEPLSNPTRAAALREVFERADLIHCVSDDMRRTVESLGAPPDRILVNRPAVPVADFTGLADGRTPHGGPLRVLSIGRLHWKKALDDGLRAVARVPGAEYRLAGEGTEREKLTFLADQLGIAGRVALLGTQTQAEVRDLLAWADVLLLPSLSEGISNAVLEAMAAGLPVIATRCGGMDEVITPGADGFLVDIGDLDAMAGHLAELAADPELRRRLGATASARAVAEFDLSRQIATFVAAYDALVA